MFARRQARSQLRHRRQCGQLGSGNIAESQQVFTARHLGIYDLLRLTILPLADHEPLADQHKGWSDTCCTHSNLFYGQGERWVSFSSPSGSRSSVSETAITPPMHVSVSAVWSYPRARAESGPKSRLPI